jgi:molybdopterin-guanine dinucleotide biosynthesis protein A
MRTLGVVLAGGKSSRFGSDKAEALLGGRPLIEHAIEALRPHCDAVAVAGRETALALSIADWPAPDAGPLGGLAGALNHALNHGFDQVLSVPVDAALLPADLRALLEPAPACFSSQPVIGLWPAAAAGAIEEVLFGTGSHSLRAFADRIGARLVASAVMPANINTPRDLARLERHHGL